jgi:tetratricopeptide (TPR) repeat protein
MLKLSYWTLLLNNCGQLQSQPQNQRKFFVRVGVIFFFFAIVFTLALIPVSFAESLRANTNDKCLTSNILAVKAVGSIETNPSKAAEVLLAALVECPGVPEVSYNLGVALSRLGRNDEALTHFRSALSDKSTREFTVGYLRALMSSSGREDEVIKEFEKALLENPSDVGLAHDLANYYYEHPRDEVRVLLEKALNSDLKDVVINRALGVVAFRKGIYAEAIKYLEVVYEKERVFEIGLSLAESYFKSGLYGQALPVLLSMREMSPHNEKVWAFLANTYLKMSDEDNALTSFEEASNVASSNVNYALNAGQLAYSLKHYERSLRAYDKAIAAGARDPEIFYAAGVSAYRAGKLSQAEKLFKQTLKKNPYHKNAQTALETLSPPDP